MCFFLKTSVEENVPRELIHAAVMHLAFPVPSFNDAESLDCFFLLKVCNTLLPPDKVSTQSQKRFPTLLRLLYIWPRRQLRMWHREALLPLSGCAQGKAESGTITEDGLLLLIAAHSDAFRRVWTCLAHAQREGKPLAYCPYVQCNARTTQYTPFWGLVTYHSCPVWPKLFFFAFRYRQGNVVPFSFFATQQKLEWLDSRC